MLRCESARRWGQIFGSPPGTTDANLQQSNQAIMDSVTSLHASIDGMSVSDLSSYIETSPKFKFVAKPNDPFGVNTGQHAQPSGDAFADGFYLMLDPVGTGTHTPNFAATVTLPGLTFSLDITDTITGVPNGHH
jgi:hypothetical protein